MYKKIIAILLGFLLFALVGIYFFNLVYNPTFYIEKTVKYIQLENSDINRFRTQSENWMRGGSKPSKPFYLVSSLNLIEKKGDSLFYLNSDNFSVQNFNLSSKKETPFVQLDESKKISSFYTTTNLKNNIFCVLFSPTEKENMDDDENNFGFNCYNFDVQNNSIKFLFQKINTLNNLEKLSRFPSSNVQLISASENQITFRSFGFIYSYNIQEGTENIESYKGNINDLVEYYKYREYAFFVRTNSIIFNANFVDSKGGKIFDFASEDRKNETIYDHSAKGINQEVFYWNSEENRIEIFDIKIKYFDTQYFIPRFV